MTFLKNGLGQSHDIIRNLVREGDIAIDATAGNGNDTLMLACLVGDRGRVYSFDIQERALLATEDKLKANGMLNRAVLIHDGHQNMGRYVGEKVRAVMFNLGYLPGGNHSIGTKGETTVAALEQAMELLEPGGVITMVVYYGGDSGFDEKEHVLQYVRSIDCRKFTVMQTEFVNQIHCPPILVCIEKIHAPGA